MDKDDRVSSAEIQRLKAKEFEQHVSHEQDESIESEQSYLQALNGELILVSPIEFRLFQFLSRQPYRAYTREQIAQAIHRDETPVSENSLDQHVASLREKLGILSDYVQTVPHIGYRFKP